MSILVIFGSLQRGDIDAYSDNDYLLVGDLKDIKYQFCDKSNIIFYSKTQLINMASAGSLFLQHLKMEGKIIVDDNDWMKKFLEGISFMEPTDKEIKKCLYILKSIIVVEDKKELLGWKADCLYVYLRDIIIKLLAKRRTILFAPEKLSKYFFIDLYSNERMANIFLNLRIQKYNFRNKLPVTCTIHDFQIIDDFMTSEFIQYTSIQLKHSLNLAEALSAIEFQDSYHKLRFAEACHLLDQGLSDKYELSKYVTSPNHYRARISRLPFSNIFSEFINSNYIS